ncbi:hypothetical protein [Pedobacter africanus]|uniref:hypothetical protein n=1 Tax=Pedobacter africanus TaxID=151894 RepID=UPI0009FD425A|nr:hypothetical protein [Pedobacter africanus]
MPEKHSLTKKQAWIISLAIWHYLSWAGLKSWYWAIITPNLGRYALYSYSGVNTIGSGLDEIEGSKKAEVKFQVRCQF